MKKVWIYFMALLGIAIAFSSCGKKSSDNEVRDFAKFFVEKISLNQVDSLKRFYPDIVKAETFADLQSDTILVTETSPGTFEVRLTPSVLLIANRSENGQINIMGSQGLFAYPESKMEMAKKTGMWNENISDSEFADRMQDKGFEKYLSDRASSLTSNILSIGKLRDVGTDSYMMQSITNNTDQPISASDYNIVVRTNREGRGATYSTKSGKDIPPRGSASFQMIFGMNENGWDVWEESDEITSVKFKIPEDQLMERFASFTGNEYQDYLNSK